MKRSPDSKKQRIQEAIDLALSYGQIDGDHHKAWVIDQMVRALTGCPIVKKKAINFRDEEYEYECQGESDEYLQLIKIYCHDDEDPEAYSWDEGCPP
jgi:hypothetical protein